MRSQTDTTPPHIILENALMEIVGYTALLDDLTIRSVPSGMDFTTDGLCGLNRLAAHIHGLAVEALGNVAALKGQGV